MLPSVRENILPRFCRREGSPEAWLLRAISSIKVCKTYILVHGDHFFTVGRREERKHALSLLRSAYELSKVVTLGPESSQSRTESFLGRTLNCTTHNQIPADIPGPDWNPQWEVLRCGVANS